MFNKALLITGLMSISLSFPALTAAETKIGYFNLVQVIEKAPQAAVALKKLEAEFAPREQEVRSLADNIKVAEEEMEKNALVWSDSFQSSYLAIYCPLTQSNPNSCLLL